MLLVNIQMDLTEWRRNSVLFETVRIAVVVHNVVVGRSQIWDLSLGVATCSVTTLRYIQIF